MELPLKLESDQMQSRWKSILDPILSNPLNDVRILPMVLLKTGDNIIDHRLGKKMQGWVITDLNGAAVIYRSAPLNDKTITLNSNANVTIALGVF